MRQKPVTEKNKQPKSLKLAVLFLGIVIFAVFLSLAVKSFSLIRESSFDWQHRFSVVFSGSKSQAFLISIDPSGGATLLTLKGVSDPKQVEALLAIPLDGSVSISNEVREQESLSAIIWQFLTKPSARYYSLTAFDLLGMYLYSLIIPQQEIVKDTFIVGQHVGTKAPLKKYVTDASIVRDDQTIAIINATGESGIGRKLEVVLATIGGSVVSVTTARDTQEITRIYFTGTKSYTVQKLEAIFGQEAEIGGTQAADILVIVGSGSLPLGIFATL